MQQSGISVGLREGSELVLGVVYNPDLDDMFWATKGNGAYLNGKKLSVSKKDFAHSILCTAMSLYRKSYAKMCSDVLLEAYNQCADFRRFGVASLEICYLAAGRVDTFFELRLFPWDFAGAAVILKEAGGEISTMVWDKGPAKLSPDMILDAPSPIIAANSKENLEKLGDIILRHMKGFDAAAYK
jgi:myo-inositol-1(or 4)-monophosphatase